MISSLVILQNRAEPYVLVFVGSGDTIEELANPSHTQ